jgi:Histidine kinase-like ATPase domain
VAESRTIARTTAHAAASSKFDWLLAAAEMAAPATGGWPARSGPATGWTGFPRVAVRTPGPGAAAIGAIRDFATATAVRWGAAGRGDDIAIVVSELVTNAFRHAIPACGYSGPGRGVRFGMLQCGPAILCAVVDPSPQVPAAPAPERFAESGRGLQVVGALSDDWGYATLSRPGKVVWAVFGG